MPPNQPKRAQSRIQKRSNDPKSKSEPDADSSLGSDGPQSSVITDHISDFGEASAAAEEPTPPEQEDLIEVPAPLPPRASTAISVELVTKMIAYAPLLRNDENLKKLTEND